MRAIATLNLILSIATLLNATLKTSYLFFEVK
nr:MAG TPA: hypothetical protein [Caudoviricetes sp.]